jgi:hypothetical protein
MSEIWKYKSVKKWLIKPNGEKRYKPTTEKANLRCLEEWCKILGKTPDELVNVNAKEAREEAWRIAVELKIKGKSNSIIDQHMSKLHQFLSFNGVEEFPYGETLRIWRLKKKEKEVRKRK